MTSLVYVATGNAGKLREMRQILHDAPVTLRSPEAHVPYPEEGGDYLENAIAKARVAARTLGAPALADDSGLEVDALDGAPGPRSARYGGEGLDDAGRVAHLLTALHGVPREARGARFVCTAALVWPDGPVLTAHGACPGRILTAPRGTGGFGYDPVFWVQDLGAAMAELPARHKNRCSHRARALHALEARLAAL